MTELADILADPRGRGCSICGAEVAAIVQVRVLARENGRTVRGSGNSKTLSRNLCEEHAVFWFVQLSSELGQA